jgi:hypothetical protein
MTNYLSRKEGVTRENSSVVGSQSTKLRGPISFKLDRNAIVEHGCLRKKGSSGVYIKAYKCASVVRVKNSITWLVPLLSGYSTKNAIERN